MAHPGGVIGKLGDEKEATPLDDVGQFPGKAGAFQRPPSCGVSARIKASRTFEEILPTYGGTEGPSCRLGAVATLRHPFRRLDLSGP